MRFKKIRGHSRIQQNIQSWVNESADLDIKRLKEFNYQYIRVDLLPWLNQPIIKRSYKEPNKLTKQLILNGIEAIYDSWKYQLEKLDQPYYLKIWLNEPRISKSEVVCGINGKIEEFENSFYKINSEENKSNLINQMNSDFKWECAVDEDFIFESNVSSSENYFYKKEFFSDRRLIKKAKKKGFRNEIVKKSNGEEDILYFIPKGKIWIGEKQNHKPTIKIIREFVV
ncbi:MAG: hypothetical protein COA40_07700 [Aequorivita sp.]|nr:MAG: hypothetical protein COA40_07700 [Aequorivita sp.]